MYSVYTESPLTKNLMYFGDCVFLLFYLREVCLQLKT